MAHPKGLLMERLKKQGVTPEFRTANTGPDHEPTFLTDVVVAGEVYGTGQGGTKREAERLAAEEALGYLDRNPLELEGAAAGPDTPPEAKGANTKGANSKGARSKSTDSKPADKPARAPRGGKSAGSGSSGRADGAGRDDAGSTRVEREASEALAEAGDRFEGPWPVFENLLAGIVEVAGERVDEELTGEEARVAVRDFTLELYKDLLEDLGDVVDDEEE